MRFPNYAICPGHASKYSLKKTAGFRELLYSENKLSNCNNVSELSEQLNKLMLASQTSATWRKHDSVWKCIANFADHEGVTICWPMDIELIRTFTVWCLSHKNLSTSTVKSYLSSLKLAHGLKGLDCVDYSKDKIITLTLKGAENLKLLNTSCNNNRRAVTLPTLLLLGHRIASGNWSNISKQVIWAACTTSFFTGARMGELLPPSESSFDPKTTVLWEDIKWSG